MTKNRYYMTNSKFGENRYNPYYDIRDKEKNGNHLLFTVTGGNTSKLIVDLLNEQDKQIKQLEAQLYCKEEEICQICKYKYLLKNDVDRYENKPSYYTAHCRKGHIECSKGNVKHCKDFELKMGDINKFSI